MLSSHAKAADSLWMVTVVVLTWWSLRLGLRRRVEGIVWRLLAGRTCVAYRVVRRLE